MKKTLLQIAIFIFIQNVVAQTFEFVEINDINIPDLSSTTMAFADVDGDGDQDVMISGNLPGFPVEPVNELFLNDSDGNFTAMPDTSFPDVSGFTDIAFADIDSDGDEDLIITGFIIDEFLFTTVLYTNDGAGNFTEVLGTPFDGVDFGSLAFADIDGDDDQDLLITGFNSSIEEIAKLYTNDGTGSFTEVLGTSLLGVTFSEVAFADIDNDGDKDLLITGTDHSAGLFSTKLYTNDGLGSFTEISSPLVNMDFASIAFFDMDADNDLDLLLSGTIGPATRGTSLYANDGTGNFSEIFGGSFLMVSPGSIAVGDVDNDNDQDIIISGTPSGSPFDNVSELYLNDGSGSFTEFTAAPFVGADLSDSALVDIDGDNDLDFFISGRSLDGDGNIAALTKIYRNDEIVLSTGDNVFDDSSNNFMILQNPIAENTLNIYYSALQNDSARIKIVDITGKILFEKLQNILAGEQRIKVEIPSFSAGNYFIILDNGVNKEVAKFIID